MSKIMTFEVSTLGDLEDACKRWRDMGADSVTPILIGGELEKSVVGLVDIVEPFNGINLMLVEL
mgnify:CR=1 FL=1